MKYQTTCNYCKKEFERESKNQPKYKKTKNEFCSKQCFDKYQSNSIEINCNWCNKPSIKKIKEIKKSKSGFMFCSRSCSASYNNTQKRKSRRSKCEISLFNKLKNQYPNLEIISNCKKLLNGLEVDIAIPSLKLAIEWNGIVHFKPIYGEEKFNKIKNIDKTKLILANQKNINLIVIPDLVSNESYVTECFYDICKIIDNLIPGVGLEPTSFL